MSHATRLTHTPDPIEFRLEDGPMVVDRWNPKCDAYEDGQDFDRHVRRSGVDLSTEAGERYQAHILGQALKHLAS